MSTKPARRAAGTWIPDVPYGEPGSLYHDDPTCEAPRDPGRLSCRGCPRAVPPKNKYPGPCARCLARVPAWAGELFRTPSGVWAVQHTGPCPEEA